MSPHIVFGGIEGGASVSTIILYNHLGEQLAEGTGLGTNVWTNGMDETIRRIAKLIEDAKALGNVPPSTPIKCMCLSLSGAEEERVNEELKNGLMTRYPGLSENYVIHSDVYSPLASVSDKGGVVLISGTGSNAFLINPDGNEVRCGGWGHMLGDEGSAYWIAHQGIKVYFDAEDRLRPPPNGYNTDVLWETIKAFFNIESRIEILKPVYKNFQKSSFAQLCKEISLKARDGDPLCQWIFKQAGKQLAKHLLALASKTAPELLNSEGGLPVVVVGSVWKSWDLLKEGFSEELDQDSDKILSEVTLKTLTTSSAAGAAYTAARSAGHSFPVDYSKNYRNFYHYKRAL